MRKLSKQQQEMFTRNRAMSVEREPMFFEDNEHKKPCNWENEEKFRERLHSTICRRNGVVPEAYCRH